MTSDERDLVMATEQQDRLLDELEREVASLQTVSIRVAKLECQLATIQTGLDANTVLTQQLLTAFQGAKGIVSFIRWVAAIITFVLATWAGVVNIPFLQSLFK